MSTKDIEMKTIVYNYLLFLCVHWVTVFIPTFTGDPVDQSLNVTGH